MGAQQKRQPWLSFFKQQFLKELFVHYVHCNFETETHFSSSWFCPHNISPIFCLRRFAFYCIAWIE